MLTHSRYLSLMTIVATTAVGITFAGGGNGKGKPNEEPQYEAGALEFSDLPGDALQSDGFAYIDGIDGTECVHADPTLTFQCLTGPDRSVFLSLGSCLWEDCFDPFGGDWAGGVTGGTMVDTDPFYIDGEGWRWPEAGETLVSNDSVYGGGGLNFMFFVGPQVYSLSWSGSNGEIHATGYDDDGDGIRDRVVMTVAADAIAQLRRRIPTTNGVRKRSERMTWELIGEFADMPVTATFYSLGYLRTRPSARYE